MGKGLIGMKLDLNPRLEKMLSTLTGYAGDYVFSCPDSSHDVCDQEPKQFSVSSIIYNPVFCSDLDAPACLHSTAPFHSSRGLCSDIDFDYDTDDLADGKDLPGRNLNVREAPGF